MKKKSMNWSFLSIELVITKSAYQKHKDLDKRVFDQTNLTN